ncbi:MAG: sialate O-acetylesterase [Akkermansiaceae bacterium]
MKKRIVISHFLTVLLGIFSLAGANEEKNPLKVYILVGQSNMQGLALDTTIPAMAWDSVSRELHDKFVDEAGKPKVYKDVQVAAISQQGAWGAPVVDKEKTGPLTVGFGSSLTSDDRFGPELGFGVTIIEHLNEPVLLIKTSWGGKSLHTDFRPPSGGPYYESTAEVKDRKTHKGEIITAETQIAEKIEATGKYYHLMADYVKKVLADPGKYHPAYDKTAGYEIGGFVWFQGFNDMVGPYPVTQTADGKKGPKDYSLYSKLLASFIRDVRKEFEAPKMPFVIGVIGVGGKPDEPNVFRDAMAAPASLPEFEGNVVTVHTAQYWDHQLGELVDRFKNVVTNKKPNSDDPYADLRKKLATSIEAYNENEKLMRPVSNKLNLNKKKKVELSPEELKETRDLQRKYGKQKKELEAQLRKSMFTEEEVKIMTVGKGSQAYHYLGSAKIYGRIGEAFANAMAKLNGIETNKK